MPAKSIKIPIPLRVEPPAGSWAETARIMAQGDDSDFDWDRWKDEMKEKDLEEKN